MVFNGFGPRNAVYERGAAAAGPALAWIGEACKRENLRPGGWGEAVYAAVDRGELSADEAERLVRSFVSAGVDTTVNGLGHLVLGFVSTPGEWGRLRADRALLKRALDESLRWDSTVQTFFRTNSAPVRIAETDVPANAKVLLYLAAANRDPRKWDRPEVFDIARPTSGHVGFGFGIQQCLEQMVARLEGEVVLEALLERVADIRLVGPIFRRLNNTLHALESLPVEITSA